MRVDVLTIFPGIPESPLRESLLGKAVERGHLDVRVHDIRDHAEDRRMVDDTSFGGGPGMVMKPEPVFAAVDALGPGRKRCILLSPAGRRLDQSLVRELAAEPWLVLVCGRYEGVDERVVQGLPAEEISIGDYVLSGGELPALVLLEAVSRLVPGVVGREESLARESFEVSRSHWVIHPPCPPQTSRHKRQGQDQPDADRRGHRADGRSNRSTAGRNVSTGQGGVNEAT